MPGLTELRNAVAGAIRDGMESESWNVRPFMALTPIPPMLEVYPKRSLYDEGFQTDEVKLTVRATLSTAAFESSQTALDEVLNATGGNSIKAILEAGDGGLALIVQDESLIGFVQDVRVEDHGDYHSIATGDGGHVLGCELTVCVVTTRPTS